MSNPVEFIQNNKEWLVPIIIAILTALITEICNLFRKTLIPQHYNLTLFISS